MNPDRVPDNDQPTSPYGPQRGHTDEAAGGADSSPYEATPTDERRQAAADPATRAAHRPDETAARP